jgi:uncharacterized protein YjdB
VFGVKGTDWDYNAAGNREYKTGISSSLGGMLNDFMQAFIHQDTGLAIARNNPSLQALDYFYDRYNAGLNGTTTPFGIGITEQFNDNSPALYPYYGVRDKWINGILNGSLTVEDLPDMNTELYGDFYNDLVQQLSVVYNSKITSNTDVTGVELNKKSISVDVGVAPIQLSATVLPSTALNKVIFWTSSDKSIATVDYTGKVTIISRGKVVITATAVDGKSISQCNIEVKELPLNLNYLTNSIFIGESFNLVVTKGEGYADKQVIYSSSDINVATVDANGLITALSEGTTIISVKYIDTDISVSCEVVVSKKQAVTDDLVNTGDESGFTIIFLVVAIMGLMIGFKRRKKPILGIKSNMEV